MMPLQPSSFFAHPYELRQKKNDPQFMIVTATTVHNEVVQVNSVNTFDWEWSSNNSIKSI